MCCLCLLGALSAAGQASASCSSSEAGVLQLHREWILQGWERRPEDEAFDFRAKLGKFYDFDAPGVLLYDDFDVDHRVAHSAAQYGAFWTAPFNALRSARHRVIDGPDVIATQDLATSTLEFAARLEAADGAITAIRTRSTLVWHCTGQGWKIVREHNSSRRVSEAEIDALLSAKE